MEASMQYYCATSASLWMAFDYSNQNGTRRRGLLFVLYWRFPSGFSFPSKVDLIHELFSLLKKGRRPTIPLSCSTPQKSGSCIVIENHQKCLIFKNQFWCQNSDVLVICRKWDIFWWFSTTMSWTEEGQKTFQGSLLLVSLIVSNIEVFMSCK